MSAVPNELARFAERVRGSGRGHARRVLAIGARADDLAALRERGLEVAEGQPADLTGAAEHALDGVWFGRGGDVDAAAMRASFRALHHGLVRVPLDERDPCDRARLELLLERGDFGVVEAAATGLVGWTKLVTPKLCAGAVIFELGTAARAADRASRPTTASWCRPSWASRRHRSRRSRRSCARCAEETGLEVEVEGLLGVYSVWLPAPGARSSSASSSVASSAARRR